MRLNPIGRLWNTAFAQNRILFASKGLWQQQPCQAYCG